MTKEDFILHMLANQMSLFTNRAALSNNVQDGIQLADEVYEEARRQLKLREPLVKARKSA